VKVRGFRIELGEIEATLAAHPSVQQTLVTAHQDTAHETRLTAYYTCADGRRCAPRSLREHLAESLPGYMIPSAFVWLEALPLTANGKTDFRALPEADPADVATAEYVAPRTPAEETLAALWAELLKVSRVGIDDDFFELGGHSLLATQFVSRAKAAFGFDVPLRSVFEASTIRVLGPVVAVLAAQWLADNFGPADTELAAAKPQQAKEPKKPMQNEDRTRRSELPPLQPADRSRPLPLSFAQQRFWFLDQLEESREEYQIALAVRLTGDLDRPALERAFQDVIRRHEALRTTLTGADGTPVQTIRDPEDVPALKWTDLSASPQAEARRQTEQITADDGRATFDLAMDLPIRGRLIRVTPHEHTFSLTIHHVAADGWSRDVLVDELAALYTAHRTNTPSPLPELCVQYGDFAVWQREWLSGERLDADLAYWRGRLAGLEPVELPLDRPRPAVRSGLGRTVYFDLGPGLYTGLMRVAQESRASLFMTLLAAYQVLLSRYSGQADIAVGVPIANRHHAETEKLIGFFVNTLVLRSDLSGNPSFADLVAQVREHALDAYEHQDLPFERLVEELQPERDLSRTPLFQTMFQLRTPRNSWEFFGLEAEEQHVPWTTSMYDLTLEISDEDGVLSGRVEFATDLFSVELIEAFVGHFRRLLECVVADPGVRVREAEFLSDDERDVLVSGWNATGVAYPEKCLHEWIEEQAVRSPGAVAVVHGDVLLTYGELEA
ncbi:condensation domain-containing protein, partial [Streptomyces zagrosensis]|nr:hypothetical protein [Streptomyces zagrosensis]